MRSGSLLKVRDLEVTFRIRKSSLFSQRTPRFLKAVNGVDFDLESGETLGIVGESGCGKSTLARAVLRLLPAQGSVMWDGDTDLMSLTQRQMRNLRSDIQMIFQDPLASLNPRLPVGEIIAEPLKTHRRELAETEIRRLVGAMMERVGLRSEQINHYPHQFSGGQCQRIGIARALITRPRLVICDEPVSALDVSIQAQIVNLLLDLQTEMGLALIFISHDLNIVRHISTSVMVLYLGRVVEMASREELFDNPRHPYTQALLSAVPIADPTIQRSRKVRLLEGDLPSPINPPSGCVFRTRCPKVQDICRHETPKLEKNKTNGTSHDAACHFIS